MAICYRWYPIWKWPLPSISPFQNYPIQAQILEQTPSQSPLLRNPAISHLTLFLLLEQLDEPNFDDGCVPGGLGWWTLAGQCEQDDIKVKRGGAFQLEQGKFPGVEEDLLKDL